MMQSGKWLSRGQRKRLAKKSKFVNQLYLEKNFVDQQKQDKEEQKIANKKLHELRKMAKAESGGDMDMSDGPSKSQSQPKKSLSDFGAMGDLLNKIETKTTKQVNHQQRLMQGHKHKETAQDRDKDRLNQLASLSAFQENTLDNLFLHVSNTIASKQQPLNKQRK